MKSTATTTADYLAEQPEERQKELRKVLEVIRKNLDPTYAECMMYGHIGFGVPLSVYPKGYHCTPNTPLPLISLANNKGSISLHFMAIYAPSAYSEWFKEAWLATGKKLDMGKACIKFKKADDLALDVLAEALRRMPAEKYVRVTEELLASRR